MKLSFEEVLVERCSATLTGVKASNLFRYVSSDILEEKVKYWNNLLGPYGIAIEIIKRCKLKGCSLVYVYRECIIEDIFSDKENLELLKSFGYGDYWKDYGSPVMAKEHFDRYRSCAIYCKERISNGASIIQIVA